MATTHETFASLIAAVVANCDEIGSYIQNTDFIVKKYEGLSALHGYNSGAPFEYLKGWSWTRSWDEYFSHVMDEWDADRMSAMRFNALIERLSAPAARLDLLVPKLERECQRLPNMPGSVVRNAREMHTCVNSFLNSADDGLNLWKRSENLLVENEIRQRRPVHVVLVGPDSDSSGPDIEVERTATHVENDNDAVQRTAFQRFLHSFQKHSTSNLALQAVTGIVSIASCIVQTQAFFLSTQLHGQSTGRASDPDFYSAMQTFLMQTLALYTALAPTLRSTGPRYGFWTCLLSALSLASSIASLAVYPSFPTLSPLVACVANALQAFVTLQLVFALDDGRHGSQTVGRKKDV